MMNVITMKHNPKILMAIVVSSVLGTGYLVADTSTLTQNIAMVFVSLALAILLASNMQ
jgi:hypothetical protein